MAFVVGLSLMLNLILCLEATKHTNISADFCPIDRCSVDLSLQQVTELLTGWASNRQVSTEWLLQQLDKQLTTFDRSQTNQRFLQLPVGPHAPPSSLTHMSPMNPETRIRFPNGFGSLSPPANAVVAITGAASVEVTVSPRMSAAEALRQANGKLSDVNGRSYNIIWKKYKRRNCFVVRSVGTVSSNPQHKWMVHVTDKPKGQVLWRDVCVPTLRDVVIRPGSVITLDYKSRNQQD